MLYSVTLIRDVLAGIVRFPFRRPSNTHDWSPDQAVLPYATFAGDRVTVHNVRNCVYRSTDDYTVRYEDRTYDLHELVSMDYMVEPFGKMKAAHTLLTFGFTNGDHVAISIEIRKKKGDSFSAVRGLLRMYELMYVVADERDVLGLRANHRKDQVYLYPVQVDRVQMRQLFRSMLERANALRERPEFYNTVTNTCLTNIVRHVHGIVPRRVPWDLRLIAPENSDLLAYELGFLDTSVPFDELKRRSCINARAARFADDPGFSRRIREGSEE